MTLKDAFTEWAAIPSNTVLAAKSRTPVQNVLLKQYGERDVREFTAGFVEKLAADSHELRAHKVKAVSVLQQVLLWAASLNFCNKPDFDYTIVAKEPDPHGDPENCKMPVSGAVGEEVAVDSASTVPPTRNEFGQFEKGMKPWNAGRHPGAFGGRRKVAVTQIDPQTLQPVRTFGDMNTAGRETGAKNIFRAIRDHKMSGGWYWALPEDAEGFQPGYKIGPRGTKHAKTPTTDSLPGEGGAVTPDSCNQARRKHGPLSAFSDEDLAGELRRRGWTGELTLIRQVKL